MTITFQKFKNFQNKWVAVNEDTGKIIASGSDIKSVQVEAEKKTLNGSKITLEFIYPFNSYLSPTIL